MGERTYEWDLPLFILQGFALYNDKRLIPKDLHDLTSRGKENFREVKIKEDSPLWVVDEYENWLKYKEATMV